jgi:hypothetical protein
MAGNTWAKRQREKTKRERKEAKRARSTDKREGGPDDLGEGPSPEELMAEFQQLNRDHAEGKVDDKAFQARRNELYIAMGVPATILEEEEKAAAGEAN